MKNLKKYLVLFLINTAPVVFSFIMCIFIGFNFGKYHYANKHLTCFSSVFSLKGGGYKGDLKQDIELLDRVSSIKVNDKHVIGANFYLKVSEAFLALHVDKCMRK